MARQEHQDIKFLWSQPQFLVVQGHGSFVEINFEVTEPDPPCLGSTLLGSLSLEHSAAWEQVPQQEKSRLVAAARLAAFGWFAQPKSGPIAW
jgi:hypothetical protein